MRRWICSLIIEADSEEDVRTKLLEVVGNEIHWQREWDIEEEEIYSDW